MVASACHNDASRTSAEQPVKVKPLPANPLPPNDGGTATSLASDVWVVGTAWHIGTPRLHVGPRAVPFIAVSMQQGFAAASTDDGARVWAVLDGAPVARISSPWTTRTRGHGASFLSGDAPLLAFDGASENQIAHLPDGALVASQTGVLKGFAAKGRAVIISDVFDLSIVDIATSTAVQHWRAKGRGGMMTLAVADHGAVVDWLREDGAFECDLKSGAVTQRATRPSRWDSAVVAGSARVAVVEHDDNAYRLDLATGAEALLVAHPGISAISPDGKTFATAIEGGFELVDGTTAKVRSTVKTGNNVNALVWSDRNEVLAYVVDGTLVLHDVTTGSIKFAEPSRFVGWLAEGSAAVKRGGSLLALDLRSGSLGPADGAAVAKLQPAAPAGAPAWATWIAESPSGAVIAAEPSKARDLPVSEREHCEPTLRVWTASGGVRTLATPPSDGSYDTTFDPCWHLAGGWVVGASTRQIQIFDPTTGKRIARITAPPPPVPIPGPLFASRFYELNVSPDGKWLGLVWRRPDVFANAPDLTPDEALERMETRVTRDCNRGHEVACMTEEFVEVWRLAPGAPRRQWQSRLPLFDQPYETWESKAASGAIAFTHDGKYALFGYEDGDIVIRSTADVAVARTAHEHPVAITRIEVSPGDGFVFTEDIEGEQRIWPLAPP